MDCIVCGKKASMLSSIKTKDGMICRECSGKIPKCLRPQIGMYTKERVSILMDYINGIDRKSFVPTASFGNLYIDELHGIFAICEGKCEPENATDIFNCLSLSNVGLVATNIKWNHKGNNVVCDFELHCEMEYPKCMFKTVVCRMKPCLTKRKSSTEVTYTFPGDYYIFIEIFNQMLETARKKYVEHSVMKFPTKAEFDLFKAETLFMLSEGYDMAEVDRQYGILMSAFDTDYHAIIEQAYYILLNSMDV